MNQELKTLNKLMSPTGGDQSGQIAKNTLLNPNGPKEVKITDAMKKAKPVVNKARSGNKLSGVSDFLGNPAVQMALINFGQAFANAGNYSGQDNPINQIGNAGKKFITSNANNKALKAFEQGKPIAQSAGQFADPNLVANLEQRRQQHEEFKQKLDLQAQQLGLNTKQYEADAGYKFATLNLNEKQANARIEHLKNADEVAKKKNDAYIKWLEAKAKHLGEGGNSENLALRRNEYLQILDQQKAAAQQNVNDLQNVVNKINESGQGAISSIYSKAFSNAMGVSAVDIASKTGHTVSLENAKYQLDQAQKELNRVNQEYDSVRKTQSAELGNGGDQNKNTQQSASKQQSTGGQQNNGGQTSQGTKEQPIEVTSSDQLQNISPDSYVNYFGTVYIWDGSKLNEPK